MKTLIINGLDVCPKTGYEDDIGESCDICDWFEGFDRLQCFVHCMYGEPLVVGNEEVVKNNG